jgi:uncharacterized protein YndB with AHSA1/START domain
MTTMSTDATAVRLQRTIAAAPADVYRAWLDPELLVRWMSPRGAGVTRAEVDERPGGSFRVWQDADGVAGGGFECELRELVPAERIVLDWRFVGPGRIVDPAHDSRLSVTLRATDAGTELTLVHERLDALRTAMPALAAKVAEGWELALDKLAVVFEPPA